MEPYMTPVWVDSALALIELREWELDRNFVHMMRTVSDLFAKEAIWQNTSPMS